MVAYRDTSFLMPNILVKFQRDQSPMGAKYTWSMDNLRLRVHRAPCCPCVHPPRAPSSPLCLPGIDLVMSLKIFGVTITDKLSINDSRTCRRPQVYAVTTRHQSPAPPRHERPKTRRCKPSSALSFRPSC